MPILVSVKEKILVFSSPECAVNTVRLHIVDEPQKFITIGCLLLHTIAVRDIGPSLGEYPSLGRDELLGSFYICHILHFAGLIVQRYGGVLTDSDSSNSNA